jgi:tetratricopeptide (TPR) repeat protein
MGDFEGATKAFERSLELQPTQLAYVNMGTLYFYVGRFKDAEKMYLKSTELAPRDNRTWGALADAQYQIAERRAEAKRSYERAISLALEELKVTPNDPDTLARMAYYTARAGNPTRSREYMKQALAVPAPAYGVYYLIALAQLELNEVDASIASLQKAIELGYSTQFVKTGPEFAKLRDDKRFQRLLAMSIRPPAGQPRGSSFERE